LRIGGGTGSLQKFVEQVYNGLTKAGVEVLYDDREGVSAGEKFTDADLLGMPLRCVVSEKTMVQDKVELKARHKKETSLIKLKDFIATLNH
ncbi:prolyl-tRNA synthetase, partial [Candidatus Jorgensenbacteria bacterium]|nr:prolyl-tRNA synthetase [Candidatus Jorgensenbacteria bacterium]